MCVSWMHGLVADYGMGLIMYVVIGGGKTQYL